MNPTFEALNFYQKSAHFYMNIAGPRAGGGPRPLVEMPDHFLTHKFGEIVDAAAGDDVWGGSTAYTGQPVSTAETLQVFSNSVQDDPTGSGASHVTVQGLDSSGRWLVETVELDGTNPVTTQFAFWRVVRASISGAVGAGGQAAGTITVRHSSTTANVFAQFTGGQSNIAAFTVPAGYDAWIPRGFATLRRGASGSYDRDASLALKARPSGEGWRTIGVIAITSGHGAQEFPSGGFHLHELVDLKISVKDISPASGTDITAGLDILCVKKALLPS